MSTTVTYPPMPAPGQVVLQGVSWELYEKLLSEVGDGNLRLTYSNGSLEIMSPLPKHERTKKLIGGLIEMIALERNLPMARLGSTTFKRADLDRGLEPDECYYIRNEARVRNKDRIDPAQDPPPDLVVEVDITHRSVARLAIYAALGVPEVWRFDGERLTGLHLEPDGQYHPIETSAAFPFLHIVELERFLAMLTTTDETSIMRAFRDWVRQAIG